MRRSIPGRRCSMGLRYYNIPLNANAPNPAAADRFIWRRSRKKGPLAAPSLRRAWGHRTLHRALATAAKRAGCSGPVSPHRLRHSFATEMLRLGVGLPSLMQLLGHKDIRMTLRYVE